VTWVKLCGMTRRRDVDAARAVGADAVGFVVHPPSPRYVEVSRVPALAEDAGVETFLVCVDADPHRIVELAADLGVGGIQPHGVGRDRATALALDAGLAVLAPVRVADLTPDLASIPAGARPLLDSSVTGMHGGTGRAFDWTVASSVEREFVLAGGLRPDTVGDAVSLVRPWGVDVATGVESDPGIKDHDAMRRFVEEARR
jgi:phosphoribosylanthranilate isomerase